MGEERLFQGKEKGGRLAGGKALARPCAAEVTEQFPHFVPGIAVNIIQVAAIDGSAKGSVIAMLLHYNGDVMALCQHCNGTQRAV